MYLGNIPHGNCNIEMQPFKMLPYAGFTLEMNAPCMQAACRTHAARFILHTIVWISVLTCTCVIYNVTSGVLINKQRAFIAMLGM